MNEDLNLPLASQPAPETAKNYRRRTLIAAPLFAVLSLAGRAPAASANLENSRASTELAQPAQVPEAQIELSKRSAVSILKKDQDGQYQPWCTAQITSLGNGEMLGAEHCFTDEQKGAKLNPHADYNNFIANAQGEFAVALPGHPDQAVLPVTGLSMRRGGHGKDGMALIKTDPRSTEFSERAPYLWSQMKQASVGELSPPKLNSQVVWTGYEYHGSKLVQATGYGRYVGLLDTSSGYNTRPMYTVLVEKGSPDLAEGGNSGSEPYFAGGQRGGPAVNGYSFAGFPGSRASFEYSSGISTGNSIGVISFDKPPSQEAIQQMENGFKYMAGSSSKSSN